MFKVIFTQKQINLQGSETLRLRWLCDVLFGDKNKTTELKEENKKRKKIKFNSNSIYYF